jgi:ribosomal protein S18 acetylase RimI-like enzyme
MYEFQDSDCYLPGRNVLLQSKAFTQRVRTLAPMVYYRDVHVPFSPTDYEALRQMRISSGFYVDHIPLWAQQIASSKRRLYFMYLSDPSTYGAAPVGMVSLSFENPQDSTLASFSSTGRVEITSLFIYSAYRHLRLGIMAMMEMERRAVEFGASAVTLSTPAAEASLRVYRSLGYREYKRATSYSRSDVAGALMPPENVVAAFLEKRLR